jgi:DNA modification methylase
MTRKETIADGVTLYLGDCREIVPELRFDIVLTDPPYGQSYSSGWATDALWAAGRAITNDQSTAARDGLLELIGDVPALVFGSRKIPEPEKTRMILTWDQGPALGMGALDLPWKPSSQEIYVLGKGFNGKRGESNVLYCPPVQSMAKNGRLHPNEKPVNLLQRLLHKCPAGVVLDPFMGSGSTGEAAVKAGRPFIGIEIEPAYFNIACRRIELIARQGTLALSRPNLESEAK